MMRRLSVWVTIAIGFMQTTAWACPLCGDALFDPTQAQMTSRTAIGFLVSIVALLGVPLLLVGCVTWRVIRSARRVQRSTGP